MAQTRVSVIVAAMVLLAGCDHGAVGPAPPPPPPPPPAAANEIVVEYDGTDPTGASLGMARRIVDDLRNEPLTVELEPRRFAGAAPASAEVWEINTGAGTAHVQQVCDVVHGKFSGPVIRKVGSGLPNQPDSVDHFITIRVPKASTPHPTGTRC